MFKRLYKLFIIMLIVVTICLIVPKTDYATENSIKIGDINGDGVIDSRDKLRILEHIAAFRIATIKQKYPEWILKDEQFKAGDINEDGVIDSRDKLRILEYIAASRVQKIAQKHPDWKKNIEDKLKNVEVTGMSLDKTSIILEKGKNTKLMATITPSNASNKIVKWKSSDENVAIVDGIGNIEAKNTGITIISATSLNGKTAICKVEVKTNETICIEEERSSTRILEKSNKINPTNIVLKQIDRTIAVGTNLQLNATITPANATNKSIIWSSSDNTIVKVSSSGVVRGIKPGKVTITARTSNNKIATCIIRVNIPAKSISLNKTSVTLNKGTKEKLIVSFNPTNTTSKVITWKSSNTNIASIDSNGTITAKSKGTATITATSKYGKTAICKITVVEKNSELVKTMSVVKNSNSSSIEKIELSKSTKALQGGEIYNNRLFLFSTGGKCNVYNIKTNKYICTFTLPNDKDTFPHCNAATFSKIFYKKTDTYPLIFINAYNDKGIQDGVCYVYRLIVGKNEQISSELKHTIKIGFTNTNIWKNSKDTKRTYGNFVIDTDNNYMYIYNLRISENKTRFFKFKIPNVLSASNKVSTISKNDIVETFDCKLLDYIQDSCYYNGNLYILSGINESHLWKLNLKTKNVTEMTLPKKPSGVKYFEPEAIGIYNGAAIVSFTDYGKTYTYKIRL